MTIQIKLKNSVVQDSTPSASDLPEVGELALNANINSIGGFMRASDNSIVKIFGPGSVSTPTATTTVSGIAELATSAETTTGSATNRVVTPAGLNAVTVAERTTSNNTYLAKAGGTLTGVLAATAGSNSAPAIHFGDSDSGIFGGTNTVSLSAGGTTRLTADTGVSVVGTLAVTGAITSTSNLTIAEKIIHSGDTNTFISFPANDIVAIDTTGNERLRVDSSGRLLIGITTPRSPADTTPRLQVEGIDAPSSSLSLTRNSASTGGPKLILNKTRGTAVGADTVVVSGDTLGSIIWAGNDGTDSDNLAAEIRTTVDGTPGSNDMPGRLTFRTTADGANTTTERMRIDSAGRVGINETSLSSFNSIGDDLVISQASGSAGITIRSGTTNTGVLAFNDGANTNFRGDLRYDHNGDYMRFSTNGSERLRIDSSGQVGIGTTPSVNLHVKDTANVEIRLDDSGQSYANFIYNNGSDSDDAFIIGCDGGNTQNNSHIRFYVDGNNEQFRIRTDGAKLNDNKKILFGSSDDLEIYHSGTHSLIKNTTGNLILQDDTYIVLEKTDGENMLVAQGDGGVDLYYNGTKRFETSSAGAQISGHLQLVGNLDMDDNHKILLGTGDDLELYHDGSNSRIVDSGTGSLILTSNQVQINNAGNTEVQAKFIENGAVELYHNGGIKLQTTNLGAEITGTTNSTLTSGSGTLFLESTHNDVICDAADDFLVRVQTSETAIHAKGNGAVELYHNGTKKFETSAAGADLIGNLSMPSGNGIDFSLVSDGSRSVSTDGNKLDDYEEGTWQPTLKFGGGTSGITYGSIRGGTYTKIGRQVTVNFGIKLTSKGSSTGHAEIHGLPFSAGDLITGTTVENNGVCAFWDNVDPNLYAMFFHTNGDHIEIKVIHDGTDAVDKIVDATDSIVFQNDTSFRGSVTYFV